MSTFSSDVPLSFKIISELALETPSLEADLGKVMKPHLQGIKSFLATATTLGQPYSLLLRLLVLLEPQGFPSSPPPYLHWPKEVLKQEFAE